MHGMQEAQRRAYSIIVRQDRRRWGRRGLLLLLERLALCGEVCYAQFLLEDLALLVRLWGCPLFRMLSKGMHGINNRDGAHKVVQGEVLLVRCDDCALNEELVLALRVQRRLLLERLQHHCGASARQPTTLAPESPPTGNGHSPDTSMLSPGSTLPEFGRTQYS